MLTSNASPPLKQRLRFGNSPPQDKAPDAKTEQQKRQTAQLGCATPYPWPDSRGESESPGNQSPRIQDKFIQSCSGRPESPAKIQEPAEAQEKKSPKNPD